MENKMMMPASYNVLSNEEMTYTEGGSQLGESLAAWFYPGYAFYVGVAMCREEYQSGNKNWLSGAWDKMTEKGGWYAAGMAINNGLLAVSTLGVLPLLAIGYVCI